jgi:hypothetical protein
MQLMNSNWTGDRIVFVRVSPGCMDVADATSHVASTTYLCTSKPLTGAHSALLPASHMEIVNTSWIFNLDKI